MEIELPFNTRISKPRFYVEDILGRKKRLTFLDQRRNELNLSSFGDKPYKSPEQSPGFFKLPGIIPKISYSPPNKRLKKSLRSQLGVVNGIFTTILKLPSVHSRNSPVWSVSKVQPTENSSLEEV